MGELTSANRLEELFVWDKVGVLTWLAFFSWVARRRVPFYSGIARGFIAKSTQRGVLLSWGFYLTHSKGFHLTQMYFKVVVQKSIPKQLRQPIRYIGNSEG